MNEKNPFAKLIVDEIQVLDDKQGLADMLEPFVIFVKASESVDFLPAFYSLSNELKVLVILAASKAKALVFKTEEKLAPKEIIGLDIMPEGSSKSIIKKLYDAKEIKAENGGYYLPGYRLSVLANKLHSIKSQKEK